MTHRRARARFAGLLVVATASTAVLTGPATAAPATPPGDTLTLVTGDVVTLGGPRGFAVDAPAGREHIRFRSHRDDDGDLHVVPEDALRLVSAGRLDPRLFDVTELMRDGYSDADRTDLPLIVDYPGATPRAAGARTVRELPSTGAVALRAAKSTAFWPAASRSATRIWLDGRVRAALDHSVRQIGAPEAWAAGHTGSGTTVAVLDTGIDVTHPDLTDVVTESRDFTESGDTDDRNGHGTHVASTIAGAGTRYQGVAPDTTLLNGKVLGDFGDGTESGVIAGMEWAAASGADVVNLSLGSSSTTDGTDPMSLAVNRLTAETGTLFVVAAGNDGPDPRTIGTPAAADAALTVGAVDRDDELAEFSSRGPRFGDGAIKPDITAPGVGIVAAAAANGWIGEPVEEGYVALSGTSMATPHVAGAAAILAGQHPDWTAERLKATLMASAAAHPTLTPYEQGAGRVDVAAAVATTVSATPPNLSVGTLAWPHDDDQPIARTVTYDNSGTEPVTLDLAVDVRGPDGEPAPAGMFTLSESEVTVPAGGSAQVTLTTDTRVPAADGAYAGALVATGGDTVVRTMVTVNREVESYRATFRVLDRDGAPTWRYTLGLTNLADGTDHDLYDTSGTVTVRLPKGEYYLGGSIGTPTEEDWSSQTDLSEPTFVVDGDLDVTLDARDGRPIGFDVDEPNAKVGYVMVKYQRYTSWGGAGIGWVTGSLDDWYAVPSRTTAPGGYTFSVEAQLAEPDETGYGFHASPYLYNLTQQHDGAVPADPLQRVTNRQLAKVRSVHAQGKPGYVGERDSFLTMPLPYTLTEYYTPNAEWYTYFDELQDPDVFPPIGAYQRVTHPRRYQAGTTTHETWNTGVFGPAFPKNTENPTPFTKRTGDRLSFGVPLFTDQTSWRFGYDYEATGTTTLLRDGEEIASSDSPGYGNWTFPPEEHTYTVRTTANREGLLSTMVSSEWTFRSGHTTEMTSVGLLAVRLAPKLDAYNRAPTGKFRIPVYVQRDGADTPGRVNTPSVEISYDDGTTWHRAKVTKAGDRWVADVHHPRSAKYASIRTSVTDRAGNTAKHTIIHAYALR